ncbi:prepilin-type N-terminal cleavage/methylation domain-containing protein [Elusimicrobium simillimum]|uniref:prepilin-type N-terminal cleavage/methylation domain-containing protein n=1 Tax=Elusimicrobium simillimum TaxID=3143438 RepID=UPI003C6EB6D2
MRKLMRSPRELYRKISLRTAHSGSAGFTLTEIMVVVIIIGILAAIGLPQYATSVERSKAIEAMSIVGGYSKLQDAQYAEFSNCNKNIDQLQMDIPYVLKQESGGNVFLSTEFFTYSTNKSGSCYIQAERRYDDEPNKVYSIVKFTDSGPINQSYYGAMFCVAQKTGADGGHKYCRIITGRDTAVTCAFDNDYDCYKV